MNYIAITTFIQSVILSTFAPTIVHNLNALTK